MQERITVTRDWLYEQVWQTPMARLAVRFGISDVALAKTCRKLEVPIPGRGHWARVSNGQKVKRPKLPKARASTRSEFTIIKRPTRDPAQQIELPVVEVSDSLVGSHRVVKQLGAELERRGLYLRGSYEATFSVTSPTKRRSLLVLDALFKSLESRGHSIGLEIPEGSDWGSCKLAVTAGGEMVELSMMEPSLTKLLEHDPDNVLDRLRGASRPRRDLVPSGRLRLRARARYATARSWGDGARQRLDEILGRVVVGIEELAREAAGQRLEHEERQRQWKVEERRRQSEAVLEHYEDALGSELEAAVEDLRRASAIRELVLAVKAAPVPDEKAAAVNEWLAWAAAWADNIDPRTNPMSVACVVNPDVAAMPEPEFNYWRDWPASEKRAETGYGQRFEPHRVG